MPALPGAGAERADRAGCVRPLCIVAGLIVASVSLALTSGAVPSAVHAVQHAVCAAAAALLALFGLLRQWHEPFDRLVARLPLPVAATGNARCGNRAALRESRPDCSHVSAFSGSSRPPRSTFSSTRSP
ncbi:hypothetical protein BSIN_0954 [Burkholderia singularis]|uniref:Uncharacterized protein n=2 Tax=Burkholderia singularis TaxID=1503053 RepID=A0A238HAF5_9BURK|nr:hypothetical protein BSIN_0954 [Burkholderia singularis]